MNQDQLFGELVGEINRFVLQDLSSLRGRKAVCCSGGRTMQPTSSLSGKNLGEPNFFTSDITPTLVAAIDSSTLPICDLEDGSIFVIRVAVVFSANGSPVAYLRLGPYPYHITSSFVKSKLNITKESLARTIAQDNALAQSLLRKAFERSIATMLLSSMTNSILLVDGTLGNTTSTFERMEQKRIISFAAERGNSILGFTKVTRIRELWDASASLISIRGAPFCIKPKNIDVKVSPDVQVILAKFREDGFVFRIDIPKDTDINALERLSGNDHFDRGYPDSLRLAHHFCVFTQHEDTCLKGRLWNELGLVEVPSEDQRKAILGWL
ncbi:MAG: hypothetical protein HYU02_08255, partial [Thaumarchaeota archaeon]|nr:hypothetical protein [Nitrososphaerota archaeon]